ncbi:beta-ketoacyl-ACP synthase 3 [Ktedonosporobacter rubrisoli]|uniref:Beta-ketoacyl-ACP synthase 3 n=1 Tax=Ktedonosporobacter rubrisoli TaxID=2509675 RepID=A0A4P6JRF1_KTERU|nr:beta-ketoacyl-ACP synthase 3 [Ktedonosporobacter rubrisoli]QBD77914.1 beta-ketoacyl-ACP synthase 3 [Ktedonosporobacter rubrisoli]
MLPVKIAGLGWYLPSQRVTNVDLEARLGIPAGWIERVTGVRERRYVTDETTVSMGAAAARMALEHAGLSIEDLDAIVMASTAPQQAIPCTAALLQRELNAPQGASACFDFNATCMSFLVALHTMAHLVAAGTYRTVLLCSSELVSNSLNPQERESAVLFGDAAAAAIITRSQPDEQSVLWHALFETYSEGADLTAIRGGGSRHHPNDPATTPEMNLFYMNGPAIFKQGARLIGPFLERFFSGFTWTQSQIDIVVPHQASRHALDVLTKRLGFTGEQVIFNLALRGNCVAASLPLAFAEAVGCGQIVRGDRVLFVGTGAGLTLGALALTF